MTTVLDIDIIKVRELQWHVLSALDVALDQFLQAGWPLDRLEVAHSTDRMRTQLCIVDERSRVGETHRGWPVFEVELTFDLDDPRGPQCFIIERWLTKIPSPTPTIGAMR